MTFRNLLQKLFLTTAIIISCNFFVKAEYLLTNTDVAFTPFGSINYYNPHPRTKFTIPTHINSQAVLSIIPEVFASKNIDSVGFQFPAINYNKLEFIGNSAFAYNNLTSIVFPESLQYIGDSAFYNNKLTEVTLTGNIVYIGTGAFGSNPIINDITLTEPSENSTYSFSHWNAYGGNDTTQQAPGTKLNHEKTYSAVYYTNNNNTYKQQLIAGNEYTIEDAANNFDYIGDGQVTWKVIEGECSITDQNSATPTLNLSDNESYVKLVLNVFDNNGTIIGYGATITDTITYQFYSEPENYAGNGGAISNFRELLWLSKTSSVWSENWIQTADIDATASKALNNDEGFSPIGNTSTRFTGTYNGLGHTISNLYINRPSGNLQGLFGYIQGAEIKNTSLIESSIIGGNSVGSIAGGAYNNSTISNCNSDSYITGSVVPGGIVGNNNNSNVHNSFFSGEVTASASGIFLGGIAGTNEGTASISNCYVIGKISQNDNSVKKGAISGYNNTGTISSCYFDSISCTTNLGVHTDNNQNAIHLTNSEFINPEKFINWNINSTQPTNSNPWILEAGDTAPKFYWQKSGTPYKYSEVTIRVGNVQGGYLSDISVKFGDSTKNTDTDGYITFYNHVEYGMEYSIKGTSFRSVYGNINTHDFDTIILYTETQYVTFTNNITNLVVDFTVTATDNLHNFTWNFGDGFTSSVKDPEHTYQASGNYTVCLNAMDTVSGDILNTCKDIEVKAAPEDIVCKASFTTSVTDLAINFTNTSVSPFTSYKWDFGNGVTSEEKDPAHTYTSSGYYTVKLTGFDNRTGCMADYSQTIYVEEADNTINYISADFNFVVTGNTVSFFSNSQGNYTDLFWHFDNNQTSEEESPMVIFDEAGYYNVCLSVYDSESGSMDEHCKRVLITETSTTIDDICNADFNYFISNDSVTVVNKSTGTADEFFWNFGNGQFSDSDTTAIAVYSEAGVYTVTLTIYNTVTECIDTYEENIVITDENLNYCFADFNAMAKGYNVAVTDKSRGDITHHFWNFGDGTYDTDSAASHTYKEPGYYTIYHSVYNYQTGCMDETQKEILITEAEANMCKADFNYITAADGNILFISKSTGDYDSFFWDYDDGTHSNAEAPAYHYNKSGYYNVLLTLKNTPDTSMCSVYKNVYVAPSGKGMEPVVSQFTSNATINNLMVEFKNRSMGDIESWYWDFGDNSTPSVNTSPSHTYAESGYYNVCLTTKNAAYQNTSCKTIVVGDVNGKHTSYFYYFADTLTNTVFFDNKSMGDIVNYTWDFGDDVISNERKPAHTYTQEGYYAVCLTTESALGKTKTYCQDINVTGSLIDSCTYNCVWPGDANHDLEANHYDILTIGMNYGMEGPVRIGGDDMWRGQNSTLWANYQIDSTNNMHGDCNGDGVINLDDTVAVSNNFAYSHSANAEEYSKAGTWHISCEVYEQPAQTKGAATTRVIRSILTDPSDKAVNEIYGLGYDLELVGADGVNWNDITVKFNEIFLTQVENDLITFFRIDESKKSIYISVSRKDQQNIQNGGAIATVFLPFTDSDLGQNLSVIVTSEGGIMADGTKIDITGGDYSINADETAAMSDVNIDVFPNPNNGSFKIQSAFISNGELNVDVYDIVGKAIFSNSFEIEGDYLNQTIDLGDVPQGVYTLKAEIEGQVVIERIVVQ